ncbi:hypothetical protein AZI86_12285 [Bdellovibrio bacteriovorus]|uniref:DUF4423 domain-containing protein n=1 Tax=Bdellovibrio bacteriovorus TaxID=959 RepID=A0A150WM36_BDEBC|nr:TIGR02147 family protein [Bdellovibrio bacteriovorus]KYG64966.1 hypothetical protein AZI86_12285 [Bdellovibrio bacteriovorus]
MSLQKPVIFEYLDLTQYLCDYVKFRKSAQNDFSYEKWADELGFKSRSYLRMIIIGKKKATESFEEAFVRQALYSAQEIEYFHFLILYSQCKTHKERQLYGKKLVLLIHEVSGQKEVVSQFTFLSDPVLPRLLILLSFDDLARNPQGLAPLINKSSEETLNCLKELESLDLAEHREGVWISKNKKFKVPNRYGDHAVRSFHENSLQEAMKAFDLPAELRRFRGLMLPLSQDELTELFGMLDVFANEVLLKFQSDRYEGRRLFQLNANILPITVSQEEVLGPS